MDCQDDPLSNGLDRDIDGWIRYGYEVRIQSIETCGGVAVLATPQYTTSLSAQYYPDLKDLKDL